MKLVSANVIKPLMLLGTGPFIVVKFHTDDQGPVLKPCEFEALTRQKYWELGFRYNGGISIWITGILLLSNNTCEKFDEVEI